MIRVLSFRATRYSVIVRRNLEFTLEMRGVKTDKRAAQVENILERVHLQDLGGRMPSQLSGGQQQRVALARDLIADPPILLLDEPLGALDRNLREQMQGEIKNLHREFGKTTICATHDQEEALTLSDRIVVMRAGKLNKSIRRRHFTIDQPHGSWRIFSARRIFWIIARSLPSRTLGSLWVPSP